MKSLRVAFIGDYTPSRTATAPFNRDLITALAPLKTVGGATPEIFMAAVRNQEETSAFPPPVVHTFRRFHRRDYVEAASYINFRDVDVCLLHHDFGLFGGEQGEYVLALARRLKAPLGVAFHHIPGADGDPRREIIRELCSYATRITVMSDTARQILLDMCGAPNSKIRVIEHGAPFVSLSRRRQLARKMNLGDRKTLITFGFLHRAKGVETVIEALPAIIRKHPDVLYVVLGQTAPGIRDSVGEVYRNYLKRLVEKYYLQEHVYFIDHYVAGEELSEFLAAADICITPYLDRDRQVSGALAYALGAGLTAVSTPFPQARELLTHNRGRLFDYGNEQQLATILTELLENPAELEKMRKRSLKQAERFAWPKTAERYLEFLQDAAQTQAPTPARDEGLINPTALPGFSLRHLLRLTDHTGIIHNANHIIPDYRSGYQLRDNAMALICATSAHREKRYPEASALLAVYLGLLHYLQSNDGSFRGFMTYDRVIPDSPCDGESFGAALWALGHLLRYSPNETCRAIGEPMFLKALPHCESLLSPTGLALACGGLFHYISWKPEDQTAVQILEAITQRIKTLYLSHRSENWRWFEESVRQPSGFLPLSLLQAGQLLGDGEAISMGLETMEFLERVNFRFGFLSLIGDEHSFRPDTEPSRVIQRPAEAMSMTLLSQQAHAVTGDPVYLHLMSAYFMWFLGDNDLGIPLYDFTSRGCADGLDQNGVLKNQGAESVISCLLAHLAVLSAHH